MCAKKIINAGIDEVIYLERYEQSNGIDILIDAGIDTRQLQSSGD
jgi:deoxycytidylate deaminase